VGLMNQFMTRRIQTFTLAFENPTFDEASKQKRLDRFEHFDLTPHRVVCGIKDFELLPRAVWHSEELSTTGIEILRLLLSKLASEKVKVVMSGEGSDEVFGGYAWFQADKLLRPLAKLPLFMRRLMLLGPLIPRLWPVPSQVHTAQAAMNVFRYRHMVGLPRPELLNQILSPEIKERISNTPDLHCNTFQPADFHKWQPFNQLQYYEMKLRLPDFVTHTLDRASMAYSLEVRVPFLDHELVEFCAGIPPALKMRRLQEKYILRQALRTTLPKEIIRHKKCPLMAPYRQWLCGKLPDFASEMLSETRLRDKGYFDATSIKHLLTAHQARKADYGRHLLGVLAVQLWDELFLSDFQAEAPS